VSEADPCARTVEWGGQTYNLNLNHRWVKRVMDYRGINGKAAAALLFGFEIGNYTADDCERILELGLVGGGMDERDAEKLIDAHVRGKPLGTSAAAAADVLGGLFMGNAS
jgi:hypothetical protein